MYGNSALKKTDWIQRKDRHYAEGFECYVSSSLNGNSTALTSKEGAQAINTNKKKNLAQSVSHSHYANSAGHLCFPMLL